MIQNVIRTAVRVVQTRRDLQRACDEEAAPRVVESKKLVFSKALDDLDREVSVAAEKYRQGKEATKSPGFDWHGLFRTALAGIEFVREVKNGSPAAAKRVRDVIEGEVVNVSERR